MGIEETDKTCPYTSLISLMVAISGLFPEWVTKWAGFFGVVGCLLRNTTVIGVTGGIEETDKTCPYTSLISLMVAISGLFPELSAPEPSRGKGFWRFTDGSHFKLKEVLASAGRTMRSASDSVAAPCPDESRRQNTVVEIDSDDYYVTSSLS